MSADVDRCRKRAELVPACALFPDFTAIFVSNAASSSVHENSNEMVSLPTFLNSMSWGRLMIARLLRMLAGLPFVDQVIGPAVRFVAGLVSEPFFRVVRWCVLRLGARLGTASELTPQSEQALRDWTRHSLVLLAATRNVEQAVFGWVPLLVQGREQWLLVGLRMMLAIGVVHSMPHVRVFAFLQPRQWRLVFNSQDPYLRQIRRQLPGYLRSFISLHVSRLSLMTAILAVLAPGWVGWLCYGLSIGLCLMITLLMTPGRVRAVLREFLADHPAGPVAAENRPRAVGDSFLEHERTEKTEASVDSCSTL